MARATRRVGRPKGPAPDPAARRTELLEAARRTLRKRGPSVSMDELAAEAGLTKPMLYAAFGDKSGLATALAEHYLTRLLPVVLAAFDETRDPKDTIRRAIDAFFAFVEADPDVYVFLVRGVGGAERSFIEQRLVASFGLRIAEVLGAGLRATDGDDAPAELWAFAILGVVISGAEWWISRKTMTRRDIVDYLSALVWGGLAGSGIDRLDARTVLAADGPKADETQTVTG